MQTSRQDFTVGLVIVIAGGILLGTLVATSGWVERRYDLFLRMSSAEGISVDSRVILQGLEVGRVRSISPRVDSASHRVSFLARLSIRERFPDGSELRFPLGTRAELVQISQISTGVHIQLLLPDTLRRVTPMLQAGDTLDATRRGSALETITGVAGDLSAEVTQVLQQTTRTLVRLQGTLAHVDATVDAVLPDVHRSVAGVAATLTRVDALLADLQRNALPDSVTAALASTNQLIRRLDSLTADAGALVADNRAAITAAVANLSETSRKLDHFVDQLSRRPYRLVTGVTPPPVRRDSTADSTGAQSTSARP